MATIRISINPNGQSATLDVDGMVVGGITMTGRGAFTADTKGKVPAIDGLAAGSVEDVWKDVNAKVRAGGVTLCWPISSTDLA